LALDVKREREQVDAVDMEVQRVALAGFVSRERACAGWSVFNGSPRLKPGDFKLGLREDRDPRKRGETVSYIVVEAALRLYLRLV